MAVRGEYSLVRVHPDRANNCRVFGIAGRAGGIQVQQEYEKLTKNAKQGLVITFNAIEIIAGTTGVCALMELSCPFV